MIASWMVYGTAVSLLLGMAALMAEYALLRWKLPTRIVWAISLAALFLVPLVAAASRSEKTSTPIEIHAASEAFSAVAGGLPPSAGEQWLRAPIVPESWDSQLLGVWILLSLGLVTFILLSYARVRRQRAEWLWSTVEGAKVLVSDHTGPAVIGFFPGEVVVPNWVNDFASADREMLIRHELEHIRARDPLLLLLGLIVVIVLPWNLVGWWQLRRLRAAIEVDCDRRVLGRSELVGSYGSLLLTVAGRAGRVPLGAAAFSTGSGQLKRRLEIMMTRAYRHRVWIGLVTAVTAGVLVLAASRIEQPIAIRENVIEEVAPAVQPSAEEPGRLLQADLLQLEGTAKDTVMLEIMDPSNQRPPEGDGRTITPAEVASETVFKIGQLSSDSRPDITNRAQIPSIMSRLYPRMLRDAGVSGQVIAHGVVTPDGRIDPASVEIIESSHPQFEDATRQALEQFTFRPGRYQERDVPVLIELPISWSVGNF